MSEEKEYYTWEQFDEDCQKIAAWAKHFSFESVFGIPRGGLVVAVRLSHLLNLPLVVGVKEATETLVVDDICDTGRTLQQAVEKLGPNVRIKVATLWFRKGSTFVPSFWCRQKTKWVVFPWETEATSKYDFTF